MAKIAFKCPGCGNALSLDAAHAGKRCRCPGCSKVVLVPASRAPGPAPAESPERCPGCGEPVAAEQVICVNCGLNLTTGERVRTAVEAAPSAAGVTSGRPVRKRYSIRFAGGKGGRGKRIRMGTPADVVLVPDEEDTDKRIEFEGRKSVPGSRLKALVLALLATGAAYWVAHSVAERFDLYSLPSFLVWYVISARMFRASIDTSLYAKGAARAVCDDDRSWISVEVSPGEWVSFVPVKGMMPHPDETDEKAYGIVRDTLGGILGENLESRR